MLFNHEKNLAEKLNKMGWKNCEYVSESVVELIFPAEDFVRICGDILVLKSEYSFIAHIKYDTYHDGFVTFENIYCFEASNYL